MNSLPGNTHGRQMLVGIAIAAAVTLGVCLILFGPAVVTAIPGLVAAGAILMRPILGLMALIFPVPFEDAVILGQIGTVTKLIGAGVAGIWFASKVLRGDSWRDILSVPLILLGVIFVTFAASSFIWAEHPEGFGVGILRLIMALALALLVIDIVRTWEQLGWLVRALVLGGILAAGLVLNQYFGLGAQRAGDAVAGGINATALVLVTLLPFGFLLTRTSDRLIWKLVGLAYVALALLALAVTFSRMSFLLLPLVFLAEGWASFRRGRGRGAMIILLFVAIVGAVRFVPTESVLERIRSIGPYVENTLGIGDGGSLTSMSERGYHLYVAFRIFQDHPLLGVGYGNYGQEFLQYQLAVPGSPRFYRSPRSPHSSFAGILAELGLIGLGIWIGLLGTCALALVKAWRGTRSEPRSQAFLTVHAVTVSFILTQAYGFYAEMQNEKVFWLVLAFAVVVYRLSGGKYSGDATERGKQAEAQTVAGPNRRRVPRTGREPSPSSVR